MESSCGWCRRGIWLLLGMLLVTQTALAEHRASSYTQERTRSSKILTVSPTSLALTLGQQATLTVSNASGSVSVRSSNIGIVIATYSNGVVRAQATGLGSASLTVKDRKTAVTVAVTVTSSSDESGSGGSTGGGGTQGSSASYTLLGWNDLGMHCIDADYSVFSILPPYNNLHAQLVNDSTNTLVTSGVTLTFEAMADATGSINTYSIGKTNFWTYANNLYSVNLSPGMGLAGYQTASHTPQTMKLDAASGQFIAEAIPITPYDDAMNKNTYPMVKVVARDSAGNQLALARVVLPVSDEMSCAACHASGSGDAAKPSAGWVYDSDPVRDYRRNILRLHDEKQAGDPVYASALASKGYSAAGLLASADGGNPVLCAACHSSNALPGTGITGVEPLTQAVHSYHAGVVDPTSGQTLDSTTNRGACYQCHPGAQTKCLRGVMGNAVLADGTLAIQCQSCHGNMSNVGRAGRAGWLDEPNCQACHHEGQRQLSAVTSTGTLKVWLDTTFATNPNTPSAGYSLYRYSKGHGNLQCEACHGATHAIYPSSHANDNVLAMDVQGRTGTIAECASCHQTVPMTTTGGPHGMHTVGQSWVSAHGDRVGGNTSACAYCHGADYRGGILSTLKVARTFSSEGRTWSFPAGHQMSCYDCHNGPNGGGD